MSKIKDIDIWDYHIVKMTINFNDLYNYIISLIDDPYSKTKKESNKDICILCDKIISLTLLNAEKDNQQIYLETFSYVDSLTRDIFSHLIKDDNDAYELHDKLCDQVRLIIKNIVPDFKNKDMDSILNVRKINDFIYELSVEMKMLRNKE